MTGGMGIAVTGMGLVTPIGIGQEAFAQALLSGRCGLSSVRTFPTDDQPSHLGGEIRDFRLEDYVGLDAFPIRYVDRLTELALGATFLALQDRGGLEGISDRGRIGLAIGVGYGTSVVNAEYHRQVMAEGPSGASPLLFPFTTTSAVAGILSIVFRIEGAHVTVSAGEASDLLTLQEGVRWLLDGIADIIVVVGCATFDRMIYAALAALGILSPGPNGGDECCRPFDLRQNGTVVSEGAAAVVLERTADAQARNASIRGDLLAVACGYWRDPACSGGGRDLERVMHEAVRCGELPPEQVAWVCAGSNGRPSLDQREAKAIQAVFGEGLPVTSMKGALGESFGASTLISLIGAITTVNAGSLPPTVGFEQAEPGQRIRVVSRTGRVPGNIVIVNGASSHGHQGSVLLKVQEPQEASSPVEGPGP